jgi:hypothetical protein
VIARADGYNGSYPCTSICNRMLYTPWPSKVTTIWPNALLYSSHNTVVEMETPNKPAVHVKVEAKAPQADVVIYPSEAECTAASPSCKRKFTLDVNKSRKAKGLGSWARHWNEDGSLDIGDKKRKSGAERGKQRGEAIDSKKHKSIGS